MDYQTRESPFPSRCTPTISVCVSCHSKCQQYSPTESNKAYDKAVNRRSGVTFEPRSVLEELKQVPQAHPRAKEDYLKHYVEVHMYMYVWVGSGFKHCRII